MKRRITFFLMLSLFGLSSLMKAQIPTSGLVAYWSFSGNYDDNSGNGNNATNSGTILTFDRFGVDESCVSFDGTDDYLSVPHSSSISINSYAEDFTISLWYKTPDPKTSSFSSTYVFNKWDGNSGTPCPYSMIIVDPDIIRCGMDDIPNNSDVVMTGMFDDNWHHLVFVNDVSIDSLLLYHDGVLIEIAKNIATANTSNTANLIIGNSPTFIRPYNGLLDDFMIYNRVLENSEITDLYNYTPCTTEVFDSTIYYVSDIEFQSESPKVYFESTDSLTSLAGNCDSIIHNYTKYVFNANHCTDTTVVYDSIAVTDTLIIDVLLNGLNPPDNVNTIRVYPNPASDYVIINTGDYNQMTTYTIEIVNSVGQIVFENLINQQEFQIDVDTFGSYGIYFVKIYDNIGDLKESRKLILH